MENRKKIGILTHPLDVNYGGVLQAYALQEVLRRMGHDVRTVDVIIAPRNKCKQLLKLVLLPLLNILRPGRYSSRRQRAMHRRHIERFVRDNIRLTVPVKTHADAEELASYRFDAWIVGSDQCWRAAYVPDPWMHFLGFVPEASAIKRIAYAVSIGTDTWDYSPATTAVCAGLAKRFDAVSVRESSAVALCREHLGVEAVHLIDPAMLLSADDYRMLVSDDNILPAPPSVTAYILDPTQAKNALVDAVAAQMEIPVRVLSTSFKHADPEFDRKYADTYIPVTQWLESFADAGFIVTDSFHGAVFSIIFNKPFMVIGNKARGMARFASLLGMFGLEDRLVEPGTAITPEMIARPIDWGRVNAILDMERKRAVEFLNKAIK